MLLKTTKMINKAKKLGAIGMMRITPDVYLKLTSHEWRDKIRKEALEVEDYNALIQGGKIDCVPYIRITKSGKVVGHEGRHRAQAIEDAGGKFIEVALILAENPHSTSKKDRYIPLEEEIEISDIPNLWKAQFSELKLPVNLGTFKPF